jgi:hypothetical protein
MISKPRCARWLPASALLLLAPSSWLVAPAQAADKKLTEDDRIEILRGLASEYATVKALLPRSPKPLPFDSTGNWDKQYWAEVGNKYGPAARLGDLVQITHVDIENDRIVFQINGGMKQKGNWRDHVQIGMAGPVSGGVSQVNTQQTSAPSGTTLALLFNQPIPSLKASDIKKILSPLLEFEMGTATENYVEKLPEPVKQAIKANKVIVGMDREQVLLAMGKPRHKERSVDKDGTETEDWIYGDPPGKITFVTFANSKVIKVKEAYADIGGTTAMPQPVR